MLTNYLSTLTEKSSYHNTRENGMSASMRDYRWLWAVRTCSQNPFVCQRKQQVLSCALNHESLQFERWRTGVSIQFSFLGKASNFGSGQQKKSSFSGFSRTRSLNVKSTSTRVKSLLKIMTVRTIAMTWQWEYKGYHCQECLFWRVHPRPWPVESPPSTLQLLPTR